jgi:hypothetical protein
MPLYPFQAQPSFPPPPAYGPRPSFPGYPPPTTAYGSQSSFPGYPPPTTPYGSQPSFPGYPAPTQPTVPSFTMPVYQSTQPIMRDRYIISTKKWMS